MNISPLSFPVAMPRRRVLAAYVQETRAECLRYLRSPSFLLPTLLFPAVFFLMFGFSPKFATFLSCIPRPIVGAVFLISAALIMFSGV